MFICKKNERWILYLFTILYTILSLVTNATNVCRNEIELFVGREWD